MGYSCGGEEQGHPAVETSLGLLLLDDLRHPELVLGIAEGEQQRDNDPLHAPVQELGGRLAHVLLAQR